MNNLTPVVNEINIALQHSKRPEVTLFHYYQTASEAMKSTIVLSMIGKLIEQQKRLNKI
ncbi:MULTISPECIES: hypothetical protein [Photorhabdus]|uniref:hypothetical protein n=1 Tax=Photorhabdus TaxID=29487 RepID=UPI000B0E0A9C|nr:hypothetical protein [Photorhabdus luminescens]